MQKRIFALLLAAAFAVLSIPSAFAAEGSTMYVYTENGKALNVRSEPQRGDNIIGYLRYGTKVVTISGMASGWTEIYYGDSIGFVQSRFLVSSKPAARSSSAASKKSSPESSSSDASSSGSSLTQTEEKAKADELKAETASYAELSESLVLSVRPLRSSGWVNMYSGPGTGTTRLASFSEGEQLIAVGETDNWYQVQGVDSDTNGYVLKSLVTVLHSVSSVQEDEDTKESLGSLNVNGEFELRCRLPQNYSMRVINMQGSRIIATIVPREENKPVLYLTIAYNELYSDVERMNDLSDEDLAILEQTFTETSDVDISYTETSHGSKLMIARDVEAESDFIDILSIYQGYFIEFVMSPSQSASSEPLTEEQIQMCIDFLSGLDFVPVE